MEHHGKEIPNIDMTRVGLNTISTAKVADLEVINIKSTSYEQFTSLPMNLCEVTVKAQVTLNLKIVDAYAKNDNHPNLTCPYQFITNNGKSEKVMCIGNNFNNIDYTYDYDTNSQEEVIQIAFKKNHDVGIAQGKLWVQLRSEFILHFIKFISYFINLPMLLHVFQLLDRTT